GALRSHVQVTLATPDTGVETQPTPGTQASSVHGSPSSQTDAAASHGLPGVGGGSEPSIRIGSLRAIGIGRPHSGDGLNSRSSYQPAGRSAGSRSSSSPLAAFG